MNITINGKSTAIFNGTRGLPNSHDEGAPSLQEFNCDSCDYISEPDTCTKAFINKSKKIWEGIASFNLCLIVI